MTKRIVPRHSVRALAVAALVGGVWCRAACAEDVAPHASATPSSFESVEARVRRLAADRDAIANATPPVPTPTAPEPAANRRLGRPRGEGQR